jgi:hypothetical protein
MIKGKWGPYCQTHMKKSSPGGKGIPTYNAPEQSKAVKSFLKSLDE